jgi:hypothetical protein
VQERRVKYTFFDIHGRIIKAGRPSRKVGISSYRMLKFSRSPNRGERGPVRFELNDRSLQ